MERLASQGVKFTLAYASAMCSPTRVSALTGMNAARHRVTNWTLRKNQSPEKPSDTIVPPAWNLNGISSAAGTEHTMQVTPLPALLKTAGHRTIQVGKAHFGAKDTPGDSLQRRPDSRVRHRRQGRAFPTGQGGMVRQECR